MATLNTVGKQVCASLDNCCSGFKLAGQPLVHPRFLKDSHLPNPSRAGLVSGCREQSLSALSRTNGNAQLGR